MSEMGAERPRTAQGDPVTMAMFAIGMSVLNEKKEKKKSTVIQLMSDN